jgi:hypothetical protein
MEVSGQLHAPVALSSGKEPLVPTGQEAEWVPEPWTRRPVRNLVYILTELSRLLWREL